MRDVTTPVLILSDVGDNRDPFATSSMYYRALRDNGKDATFFAYPVDGHFPSDPVRTPTCTRAGSTRSRHLRLTPCAPFCCCCAPAIRGLCSSPPTATSGSTARSTRPDATGHAPGIVAGRDALSGGSWFGANDDGVVATIVNGMDRLGPLPGKASRGDLVLRALRERDAHAAAQAIGALPAERYRGFTLLLADRGAGPSSATSARCASTRSRPAITSSRPTAATWRGRRATRRLSPGFCAAVPPQPERGDWESWTELLRHADEDDPHRAMTVVTAHDFGTVSSSLLASRRIRRGAGAALCERAADARAVRADRLAVAPGFTAATSKE